MICLHFHTGQRNRSECLKSEGFRKCCSSSSNSFSLVLMALASCDVFSWSNPKRCKIPWIKSLSNRASRDMPACRASRAAVSQDMTTSPKRFWLICPKVPSRIGNAITFVGPDRPKYILLSLAISRSPTIRMDSSPSGHSKAFNTVFAFFSISS